MAKSVTLGNKSRMDVKKLVTLSLMTAIAYLTVFVFRIPVVMFLKY